MANHTKTSNISTNSADISENTTNIAALQNDIIDLKTVAWDQGSEPPDLVYVGGNVGIGTRDPTAELEVDGIVKKISFLEQLSRKAHTSIKLYPLI